jgi:acetyl esterase
VLPVLVYFHGGGWVIGDLDTHDACAASWPTAAAAPWWRSTTGWARSTAFPAAVDDCLAATRWVQEQAVGLGLDASRIAVGGDSAGGNLAAVVAITLRDAAARWARPACRCATSC